MAHSPISISFETQILAVLHQNLGAGELRNVCLADCAGSTASLKANGDCLSVFHTRDLLINTQSQRNDAKTVNPCGFCTGACRNRFGNFAPRHGPILLKSLFNIDLPVVIYNTRFQGKIELSVSFSKTRAQICYSARTDFDSESYRSAFQQIGLKRSVKRTSHALKPSQGSAWGLLRSDLKSEQPSSRISGRNRAQVRHRLL